MSKLTKSRLRNAILKEFKMLGMGSPAPMKIQSLAKSGCYSCGMSPCGCDDDGSCDACGGYPCKCDGYDEPAGLDNMNPNGAFGMGIYAAGHISEGSVSREACCEAVMCMVECCACPVTKAALIECCQAIMSGEYDQ